MNAAVQWHGICCDQICGFSPRNPGGRVQSVIDIRKFQNTHMKLEIEQKDGSTQLPEVTDGESKSFRRAGSITKALMTQSNNSSGFAHHGLIAGILLMAVAYVTFILCYMFSADLIQLSSTSTLILCGSVQLVWMWACVHLALFAKFHPAWGLLGIFFLIGLMLIFWNRLQSPNWQLDKARRHTSKAAKKAAKKAA